MSAAIATRSNTSHSSTREQRILQHYPLVRTIAARMIRRFPSSVELDELVNVGALGLIDAVDRFDPSRQVPFKAYAEIRIRGAIVDALREADWVPRSVRRKHNRIEAARDKLVFDLDRAPSREELAAELELSDGAYEKLEADARLKKLVSLDAPVDDDNDTHLIDRVASSDEDFLTTWEKDELKAAIVNAVHNLPRKERTAVSLYYLHGMTLKEIGQVLGVTESRACQLRSSGIRRLKFRLDRSED